MRVDAATGFNSLHVSTSMFFFWSLNREKREQELCSLREKNPFWRRSQTQRRIRSPHTLWEADPPPEEVPRFSIPSNPELSEFSIPFIRFITGMDTQTLCYFRAFYSIVSKCAEWSYLNNGRHRTMTQLRNSPTVSSLRNYVHVSYSLMADSLQPYGP